MRRPQRVGKPKVGLAASNIFAHAVQMGMGKRQVVYTVNEMLKENAKVTATSPTFVKAANTCQTLSERSP